jgi:hypothetical protein
MLEVKPEVETAVDVATSGDPCCETARDKIFEALKNFEATFPNNVIRQTIGKRFMSREFILFMRESSCEDLAGLIDAFILHKDVKNTNLLLEIIDIRNEWIECNNTGEPIHAIPVK